MPARLWHRVPWLLLGLLGAALAAWLVDGFETELAGDNRIVLFVPGVVYMADAVGPQTEALVIRGLSVRVSMRSVLRLEVLTGLFVGLLIGGLALPAVWLAFGPADLAVAVALSLLAACAGATVVAMALPWAMDRLGRDPAFGSGPLATVVQDLLSLLIYFAVDRPHHPMTVIGPNRSAELDHRGSAAPLPAAPPTQAWPTHGRSLALPPVGGVRHCD